MNTRQTKLLSVWLLPDSSSAHKLLSGGKLLFELEKSLLVITKLQSFSAQRFSVLFPVAAAAGGAGRAHDLKAQAAAPQAGRMDRAGWMHRAASISLKLWNRATKPRFPSRNQIPTAPPCTQPCRMPHCFGDPLWSGGPSSPQPSQDDALLCPGLPHTALPFFLFRLRLRNPGTEIRVQLKDALRDLEIFK